jgi:hypothetical protein
MAHLLEDGRDLYWNELEWEHITDEEAVDAGEPLIELMFPGLLAYVRGLLLTEVNPDSLAPAEPRPSGPAGERNRSRGELRATDRLIGLILYLYHGLTPEDIHLLETAGTG